MLIREEVPSDYSTIKEINDEAFKGLSESMLVDQLRKDGFFVLSLVALDGAANSPVGHILFSELDVEVDGRVVKACSLAPIAVRASHQRKGFGSELIRKGLTTIQGKGYAAVIVLGHPEYYPRFGFNHQLVVHLSCPFQENEAFMGKELILGSLAGKTGTVRYPPAFGIENP